MGVHANAATTTTTPATALTTFAATSEVAVDTESEYCSLSNRITFMEDVDED